MRFCLNQRFLGEDTLAHAPFRAEDLGWVFRRLMPFQKYPWIRNAQSTL